jgi:hypothetical protein
MLAADSHIRRPRLLDSVVQRQQALVLNMSLDTCWVGRVRVQAL